MSMEDTGRQPNRFQLAWAKLGMHHINANAAASLAVCTDSVWLALWRFWGPYRRGTACLHYEMVLFWRGVKHLHTRRCGCGCVQRCGAGRLIWKCFGCYFSLSLLNNPLKWLLVCLQLTEYDPLARFSVKALSTHTPLKHTHFMEIPSWKIKKLLFSKLIPKLSSSHLIIPLEENIGRRKTFVILIVNAAAHRRLTLHLRLRLKHTQDEMLMLHILCQHPRAGRPGSLLQLGIKRWAFRVRKEKKEFTRL